jgi:5'-3' exonuclease
MQSHYLKYLVPYRLLFEKLNRETNYKRVIFYLDVLSISRGFYNKKVIDKEIAAYIETQKMPTLYPKELKEFLNAIYGKFKQYSPKFVLFYDGGECLQNTTISKFYKEERASSKYFFLEDKEKELMNGIKSYYLSEVINQFNKPNLSCVAWSQQYEMDLIPHYVISKNFINSQDPNTLNVILSIDKDLLQTCRFENTVQAVSTYKKATGIDMVLYDKYNAVKYIHKGFKRGGLTAEYVPLILALSGDKIDGIKNVPRMGPATAVKAIQMYNLPPRIMKDTPLGSLEEHRELIMKNQNLTCFDRQIERIPIMELNKIDDSLRSL